MYKNEMGKHAIAPIELVSQEQKLNVRIVLEVNHCSTCMPRPK